MPEKVQTKSSHAHLKKVYVQSDKAKAVTDVAAEAMKRKLAGKPCTKEWHALLKESQHVRSVHECPYCKHKI